MEDFLDGRFPGCPFSFKFDGVSCRRHEASHNPPSNEMTRTSEDPCQSEVSLKDDVYNYNCALLADGLFFLNFVDAVSEGDGFRLITQYKFMMLYCRADGHHSNKYALECLYQAFCVNALLSPRDCERLFGIEVSTTKESDVRTSPWIWRLNTVTCSTKQQSEILEVM